MQLFTNSIYFFAYGLFLTGVFLGLKKHNRLTALWIMVCGVVLDFFATVIPCSGFKSLAINIGGSGIIVSGIALGVLVWVLFLVAFFVRLMEKQRLFSRMITIIAIAWCADLAVLLYGIYSL